jgi:hypothetical protein
MVMNKLVLLVVAATILATPLCAGEVSQVRPPSRPTHLEPAPIDTLSSDPVGRDIHSQIFGPEVRLRAIVYPSFHAEFAVAVIEHTNHSAIIWLEPSDAVVSASWLDYYRMRLLKVTTPEDKADAEEQIRQLEKRHPHLPAALKADRCEISVTPALREKLISVWSGMLLKVNKPDEERLGLDGEDYHFSMPLDGKELRGKIWSPPDDTDPGRLAGITWAMRDYCRLKSEEKLAAIEKLADQILQSLKTEGAPSHS